MRILNKILIVIGFLSIIFSCQNSEYDQVSEYDVYSLINTIIPTLTEGNTKCDVIVDKPISNITGKDDTSDEELLTLKKSIKRFYKENLIKRKDINYLLTQQNDTTFIFNQNQIQKKLISRHTIDSIFSLPNSHAYFTLYEEFNIATFGKISKPFFTRDKNTAIIVFEVYRNYENANGYIIICKKTNDKWTVFERRETWIS